MVPMETSEWLSIRSKRKYLQEMRWRYARPRRRRHKSRPIEELMALCGYSRKHAIGLLNGRGRPRLLKRSGPKPFIHRSKCSWCSSGFGLGAVSFCGKRLQAALPEWLPELRERIRRARFTA